MLGDDGAVCEIGTNGQKLDHEFDHEIHTDYNYDLQRSWFRKGEPPTLRPAQATPYNFQLEPQYQPNSEHLPWIRQPQDF